MRLVLITLAGMTATAHADERTTTLTFGGSIGGRSDPAGYDTAKSLGGALVELAWEHAPPAMPAQPGYNTDGSLVPELVAGLLADDQRGELMLGAGVRAELRIAQREQGLFKISAKCALYAAARGLVIGKHQDAAAQLVVGDYVYLARTLRLGVEGGAIVRRDSDQMASTTAVLASMYLGWVL